MLHGITCYLQRRSQGIKLDNSSGKMAIPSGLSLSDMGFSSYPLILNSFQTDLQIMPFSFNSCEGPHSRTAASPRSPLQTIASSWKQPNIFMSNSCLLSRYKISSKDQNKCHFFTLLAKQQAEFIFQRGRGCDNLYLSFRDPRVLPHIKPHVPSQCYL